MVVFNVLHFISEMISQAYFSHLTPHFDPTLLIRTGAQRIH